MSAMSAITPPPTTITPALLAHLHGWQGRSETLADQLTAAQVAALAATLDRDDPPPVEGGPLPPLWHWMYFLPHARQSQLGEDGHPQRGGFLPPVPLPRRMWAGSRLSWNTDNPLAIGERVERRSTIGPIQHKAGRSGDLIFVQVEHQYRNAAGLALTEEHDIVYRSAAPAPALGTGASSPLSQPGEAAPAPQKPPFTGQAAWSRAITADPVMLFRYSALTFNGHRIHYDRPYVTEVEGYAGLVVHGPLIATLLVDLLRRNLPQARLARFDFRAVRPTIDLHPFCVYGRPDADGKTVHLWAEDHQGWLTMQGTAVTE